MNQSKKRLAFLFPGQGAQVVGMGRDFFENFSVARRTFEEADEILKLSLSSLIFGGPSDLLKETKTSQLAIYVTGVAILRVVQEQFKLFPTVCSGLSLGEYTALTAAGILSFQEAIALIGKRAEFMQEACQKTKGSMVALLGVDAEAASRILETLHLPADLWIANFNCPGQIVFSGTEKGLEALKGAASELKIKKIIPLEVGGAFHSGLMQEAQERLTPFIAKTHFEEGLCPVVMNVPGDFVFEREKIRDFLAAQVTHSVRWEMGILAIEKKGVDLYLEFGPGKTLAGMNKRIGIQTATLSIDKIEDLNTLTQKVQEWS